MSVADAERRGHVGRGLTRCADPDALDVLLRLVFDPTRIVTRIQERITSLEHGTIRREIDFELDLPPTVRSSRPALILPLLKFRKDRLLNDRPVSEASGLGVEMLNRREATAVHTQLIQAAVSCALDSWAATTVATPQRDDVMLHLVRRVGMIPGASPVEAQALLAQIDPETDEFVAHCTTMSSPTSLYRSACAAVRRDTAAWTLCQRLTTHEYLLVETKAGEGNHLALKVVYDSTHQIRRETKLRSLPRRVLASPNAFRINTPLALQAQSYHVRMMGPPNHFVREQSFRVPAADLSGNGNVPPERSHVNPIEPPTAPAVILGKPTQASAEAHLYAGGLTVQDAPGLSARFVFAERPPGTLGAAASIAFIQVIMLAGFRWALSGFIDGRPGLPLDVSCLLLLVPGAVAAAITPAVFSRSLPQRPLRARLALLGTGVIGLSAAAILAFSGIRASTARSQHHHGLLNLGWTALIAIQAVLAASAGWGVLRNYREWTAARARAERTVRTTLPKASTGDPGGIDVYTREDFQFLRDERQIG